MRGCGLYVREAPGYPTVRELRVGTLSQNGYGAHLRTSILKKRSIQQLSKTYIKIKLPPSGAQYACSLRKHSLLAPSLKVSICSIFSSRNTSAHERSEEQTPPRLVSPRSHSPHKSFQTVSEASWATTLRPERLLNYNLAASKTK